MIEPAGFEHDVFARLLVATMYASRSHNDNSDFESSQNNLRAGAELQREGRLESKTAAFMPEEPLRWLQRRLDERAHRLIWLERQELR